MHEHLDEMGLIHMNGRIFDPLIGRFMSADPFIQAPENLQSHNRFAYVMNNPLAYTDPSGYFFRSLFRAAFKIFSPVLAFLPQKVASVLINFASLACNGYAFLCAGAGQAALSYYHGASFGDAVRTGVRAGATAYLFQQAGGFAEANGGAGSAAGYAAHAGAGCVSSAASGASCGRGALSAVTGYGATDLTSGFGQSQGATAARFAVTTIAGGVASRLSGGSFVDGAQTAAYGYLFNELLHSGDRRSAMLRAGYRDGGSTLPYDPPLEGVYPEGFLVGAGGAMKGVAGLVDSLKGVGGFFGGAAYTEKVLGQMSNARDLHHAFPLAVDAVAAQAGQITKIIGGDGATYFRLQAEGTVNGVKGVFEYIKNASGQINHRLFNTRP